jgi:hypothetical protein
MSKKKLFNSILPREEVDDLVKKAIAGARIILSERRNWTRGAIARDESNRHVDALNPDAEKWCAMGAISLVATKAMREAGLSPEQDETNFQNYLTAVQQYACNDLIDACMEERGVTHYRATIPRINDGPGGYLRILNGLNRLLGLPLVEKARMRSEAARKGWETRRKRNAPPAPEVMTFGGTIIAHDEAEAFVVTNA